jgi:hypothetical protein
MDDVHSTRIHSIIPFILCWYHDRVRKMSKSKAKKKKPIGFWDDFNKKCKKCIHKCKQSHVVVLERCLLYEPIPEPLEDKNEIQEV